MRRDLPSEVVTFVFTDVEGSTRLLRELGGEGYAQALAAHRSVVRGECVARRGVEVDTQGDAFFVAFPSASQALEAAEAITRKLGSGPVAVRIGLHSGRPLVTDEGYVGEDVHLAARIAAAGHGGQVILSRATQALLDTGWPLVGLGEHRFKDIAEPVAIFQLGGAQFPPLKTISNTNLPRPASSFVGRDRELSDVPAEIEEGRRLLTLTGPGGSGKTRLALEAAAASVPHYPAGVFWVGLAALGDATLVYETIAQTLGAKDGLAAHIGEREMLLLLDNFEQVIEAAPELSALLTSCPNLTLLVTSRELLCLDGEVEYSVPPLAETDAVSLFTERARAEPSDVIAELCRRLDSLPLAVELAAARTKALSPPQILERLSHRLDLFSGNRDADARQRTLRATIAWSHDLLSRGEQRLFRRLAVFPGGSTLTAAEEVCDADVETIQSLVEKSLVRFSGERYWMLETIREYALERLHEGVDASTVMERRAAYLLNLAEEAAVKIQGPAPGPWADRLEEEHDNLRATLDWAEERGDADLLLRLSCALAHFWGRRGYLSEGRLRLERALALGDDPHLRARALHHAGFLTLNQGLHDRAETLLEEGWTLARGRADHKLTASLLLTLAGAVSDRDEARAESLYDELESFVDEHGDEHVPNAFINLADFALRRGDYANAERHSRKTLLLLGEDDDAWARALALGNLGLALLGLGRTSEAREQLNESLLTFERVGDLYGVAVSLSDQAFLAADRGEIERATRLLGKAVHILDEVEAEIAEPEATLFEQAFARARDECPDFQSEWSQGQAMTIEEAVAEAVAASSTRGPTSR